MFDGAVSELDREAAASYEAEWTAVHRKLCELARRRVELEAEEGTYLLEAQDLRVFKRLGYRTMVEYMVGELDYTRHAANERLRVSRELLSLPKLAAAHRNGELCFSKLRELTRVVTPATEEAFLVEAQGKDSHQVAKMVSGLRRGDLPDAVPDPALVTRRVVFELHAEALGLLSARTAALRAQLGRKPSHDELVIALCTMALGNGEATRRDEPGRDGGARHPEGHTDELARDLEDPSDASGEDGPIDPSSPTGDRRAIPPPIARQVFMTCKHCARSELVVGREALAIDRATAEHLACDAELAGDLDDDDRTRVTSTIPAAIRRKVFMRDAFCCVVPGFM